MTEPDVDGLEANDVEIEQREVFATTTRRRNCQHDVAVEGGFGPRAGHRVDHRCLLHALVLDEQAFVGDAPNRFLAEPLAQAVEPRAPAFVV